MLDRLRFLGHFPAVLDIISPGQHFSTPEALSSAAYLCQESRTTTRCLQTQYCSTLTIISSVHSCSFWNSLLPTLTLLVPWVMSSLAILVPLGRQLGPPRPCCSGLWQHRPGQLLGLLCCAQRLAIPSLGYSCEAGCGELPQAEAGAEPDPHPPLLPPPPLL